MRHQLSALLLVSAGLAPETAAQSRLLWRGTGANNVQDFMLTADGGYALFWRGNAFGTNGVYKVPLDTLGPIRKFADSARHLTTIGSATDVVYSDANGIRRRPVDGSRPELNLTPGFDTTDSVLTVSPGETHIVFVGAPDGTPARGLFLVPSDGSALPVEIGAGLEPSSWASHVFTPDGERVLFTVRSPNFANYLYSVPRDGNSPPVALYTPSSGEAVLYDGFLATPGRVGFVAWEPSRRRASLFSVPADGSGPAVRISHGTADVPGIWLGSPQLTPDGNRAVYVSREAAAGSRLFSVPLDGSGPPVAISSADPWVDVFDPAITPDGGRVVFRADQTADERFELFSAPLDGSAAATRLHAGLPQDRDVLDDHQILGANPGLVFFIADLVADDIFELFKIPADGSAVPSRVSGSLLGSDGDVYALRYDARGAQVLYWANEDSPDVELYAVPIDGQHRSVRLSPRLGGGEVSLFAPVHTAGGKVLFVRTRADGLRNLYAHARPVQSMR